MGFFDKVKKSLNIGGAKLTISGPGTVQNGQNLEFKAVITGGKMDQTIKDVKAKVVMAESKKSYNLQGNSSQSIQYVTVGQEIHSESFEIKAGETKEIPFTIMVNVPNDGSEQTGAMGTLNKLGNMASGLKRVFKLKVEADIEGSTDTGDEMDLQISM